MRLHIAKWNVDLIPFEIVYKLAKYYNVEAVDFLHENNLAKPVSTEAKTASIQNNSYQTNNTQIKSTYKNIWNIISPCVSALCFGVFTFWNVFDSEQRFNILIIPIIIALLTVTQIVLIAKKYLISKK